jgi:uncharacterized membrane protein
MDARHATLSAALRRHVRTCVMTSLTYVMSFGLGIIVGAAVGIWLVFRKMHWLVKWGLVDE